MPRSQINWKLPEINAILEDYINNASQKQLKYSNIQDEIEKIVGTRPTDDAIGYQLKKRRKVSGAVGGQSIETPNIPKKIEQPTASGVDKFMEALTEVITEIVTPIISEMVDKKLENFVCKGTNSKSFDGFVTDYCDFEKASKFVDSEKNQAVSEQLTPVTSSIGIKRSAPPISPSNETAFKKSRQTNTAGPAQETKRSQMIDVDYTVALNTKLNNTLRVVKIGEDMIYCFTENKTYKNGKVGLVCQQCLRIERNGMKARLHIDAQGKAKVSTTHHEKCSPLTKKQFEQQQIILRMKQRIDLHQQRPEVSYTKALQEAHEHNCQDGFPTFESIRKKLGRWQ